MCIHSPTTVTCSTAVTDPLSGPLAVLGCGPERFALYVGPEPGHELDLILPHSLNLRELPVF